VSRRCWRGSAIVRIALVLGTAMGVVAPPVVAQQPATRALTGLVTDSATAAPLAAVQVLARAQDNPTVTLASSTGDDGRFVIRGVTAGQYEVRFIRMGFAPDSQQVTVAAGSDGTVDIGTIRLRTIPVQLSDVQVVTEQPSVVYAADRDIYLASAVAGAAGGSVSDILRGIPDLEVDINGAVKLLGEGPAIYINGRPAPMRGESLTLFLEQFAAENIESIEVMPNPSPRYNAEGAGGIVNIVLKKDVGLGLSGNAFASGGTRGQLRGGGRATLQRGPLTLNGGASLGLSGDQRSSTELRQNLLTDPITFLRQAGSSDRSNWNGNLDLGATYRISPRTEVEAEARIDHNTSDADRITRYTEMDAEQSVTDEYDMFLLDDGLGGSMNFALELQHKLGGDGDVPRQRGRMERRGTDALGVEIEYSRGRDRQHSLVERRLLEELGAVDPTDELTWTEERETDAELAVGVDFARGLGKAGDLEVGYDGEFGWTDEGRLEEVRVSGSAGNPVGRTSRGFMHRQMEHSAYFTLSRKFGELGAQVGARAEHVTRRIELPGDGGTFENDELDVFPNVNLNYAFSRGKRIRLSYSMRVGRPSSNVLNPINTSSDPLNRRIGNPAIESQYTHSYMLNASWSGELGDLRASPFFRRSTNEWEQIRTVDEDGISTTTYENLGSTNSYGVSLSASLRDVYGIRTRVSLNGQRTDRNYAAVLGRTSPSATRWSVRTNLDGRITSMLSAQGALTYTPARDLPQGRSSSTLMTSLGVRYRFIDGRASMNLNVTDPFDIYDSSIQRSARGYIESGRERVSMRRLRLSLSYSFQSGGGRRGGR
jgi:hypothetical protein